MEWNGMADASTCCFWLVFFVFLLPSLNATLLWKASILSTFVQSSPPAAKHVIFPVTRPAATATTNQHYHYYFQLPCFSHQSLVIARSSFLHSSSWTDSLIVKVSLP
uniref:Uncharacterized protein n=1 Tax=Caenorhabditis japonica TaxID=281687 RepID=A0A8R1EUW6_CAEJA